jgi:hypothetical protein
MRYEDIFSYLKKATLAEIRLDLLNLTDEQVKDFLPLMVT